MLTPEEIAAAQAAEAAKEAAAQAAAATAPPTIPSPEPTSGDPDDSKMDANTKAYIQQLRKENAKYRTEAKANKDKLESVKSSLGLVGDETPEDKAKRLAAERETVAFENAVLSNAIEHGVPKEGMEYFQFMLAKAAGNLKAGEELPELKIAEIAKEAKAKSVKPQATTTVTSHSGGVPTTPPPAGTSETVTVEKFTGMGFNERVKLYETNPSLYESLMAQATQKRLIK